MIGRCSLMQSISPPRCRVTLCHGTVVGCPRKCLGGLLQLGSLHYEAFSCHPPPHSTKFLPFCPSSILLCASCCVPLGMFSSKSCICRDTHHYHRTVVLFFFFYCGIFCLAFFFFIFRLFFSKLVQYSNTVCFYPVTTIEPWFTSR